MLKKVWKGILFIQLYNKNELVHPNTYFFIVSTMFSRHVTTVFTNKIMHFDLLLHHSPHHYLSHFCCVRKK